MKPEGIANEFKCPRCHNHNPFCPNDAIPLDTILFHIIYLILTLLYWDYNIIGVDTERLFTRLACISCATLFITAKAAISWDFGK